MFVYRDVIGAKIDAKYICTVYGISIMSLLAND